MVRECCGKMLRRLADRLDPGHAPRAVGWSFTFEPYRGMVWHDDRRGCPVWYLSEDDYRRAFNEEGRR